MLAREILKKVKQIEIRTRGLVDSFFGGEYHSSFKGRGMTFSEVREYQPGDDVRLIDWNVTARSGNPFIKVFEEERELTVMLIVDISSSGSFGTENYQKREIGAEIASVLGFSAIKNNDKVGLVLFSDDIVKYIPPKKGKSHILRVIRELLYAKSDGKGTSISKALDFVMKVSKRKSVVFLLSDFLDEDYWDTDAADAGEIKNFVSKTLIMKPDPLTTTSLVKTKIVSVIYFLDLDIISLEQIFYG